MFCVPNPAAKAVLLRVRGALVCKEFFGRRRLEDEDEGYSRRSREEGKESGAGIWSRSLAEGRSNYSESRVSSCERATTFHTLTSRSNTGVM